MPWGLKRYQQARDLHFITFSCYRRQPLLASAQAKQLVERALERARQGYGFYVTGYVIMPEHVHLLVSEPERSTLASRLFSPHPACDGEPAKREAKEVFVRQGLVTDPGWRGRRLCFRLRKASLGTPLPGEQENPRQKFCANLVFSALQR